MFILPLFLDKKMWLKLWEFQNQSSRLPPEAPPGVWAASGSRCWGSGDPGWWSCRQPGPSTLRSGCIPCRKKDLKKIKMYLVEDEVIFSVENKIIKLKFLCKELINYLAHFTIKIFRAYHILCCYCANPVLCCMNMNK